LLEKYTGNFLAQYYGKYMNVSRCAVRNLAMPRILGSGHRWLGKRPRTPLFQWMNAWPLLFYHNHVKNPAYCMILK